MRMTLKDLDIGQAAKVERVGGERILRRRLLDMGITPGIEIKVLKTAPLKDPIEILIRGYILTIRLDEASKISVVRSN